jgi:hypothetical protein
MHAIFGRLGAWTAGALSAETFLIVLDGLNASVQRRWPNPVTAGYLGLRNLRFTGQVPSKGSGA